MRIYKKRKYIKRVVSHMGSHYKITPTIEKILIKSIKSMNCVKVEQDDTNTRFFYHLPNDTRKLVFIQNGDFVNATYLRQYLLAHFPLGVKELVIRQMSLTG